MNTTSHLLPTLTALIRERLAALEATKLPAAAMAQIERDVLAACRRAVERAVTAPRVGRAVAAALAATADSKGRKGADAPLPSSVRPRKVGESVAGFTQIPEGDGIVSDAAGVSNQPPKEVA
jgi:hypothetical protein